MNKDVALYRYALEVFSKYDFKDYQTQIYEVNFNDGISFRNGFQEKIIEYILENLTKENNYNRLINEKTIFLFAYTKDKKKVIFIKIDLFKEQVKVSLLLEDKNKIDNFTQNKKITKQESIDKNFYKNFFNNLNKEINKEIEQIIDLENMKQKSKKYNYPPIELLDKKEKNSLRELIDNNEFYEFSLPWGVGTEYDDGSEYIADLTKMPSLLIAGSNHCEINLCINNIILSVLYHFIPEEVIFGFIGSKIERSVYRNMPNYHHPISDIGDRIFVTPLKVLIKIMNERYEKYAKNMVRNIEGYNIKMSSENKYHDPYIIVIIKDLADLMADYNSKEIEQSIVKLLQMGKAVGIHLILATQTPTEKVIPFDIRANIPSRLAFKVRSAKESNVILDCSGAEKLNGKGDMLFLPQSELKPIHIQSAFVSEKEVKKVIKFLSKQGQCIN